LISLSVKDIGKRFSREWIFRGLSYDFKVGEPVAIVGPNGSGKSTLVKSLSGTIPVNEGSISFKWNQQPLEEEVWHQYIGISAPYLELIEEFTLAESIDFHVRFRPLIDGITKADFMAKLGLERHKDKYLRDFSSGMKQKLKLGFAFFTKNDILILDEPTANIDHNGYLWYMEEVQKLASSKILIISSNEHKEYTFCTEQISILDYK
jgi:ABC-type multidrug transport system ATPase subunit